MVPTLAKSTVVVTVSIPTPPQLTAHMCCAVTQRAGFYPCLSHDTHMFFTHTNCLAGLRGGVAAPLWLRGAGEVTRKQTEILKSSACVGEVGALGNVEEEDRRWGCRAKA